MTAAPIGMLLSISLSALAFPAAASTPLPPLAFPNLDLMTNGSVKAVAMRPGGGVVFGGTFTEVDGVPRANLARLNADGSLDATWVPTIAQAVGELVVDDDDTVYASGRFSPQGQPGPEYLEKFPADGGGAVEPQWSRLQASVSALVLDGRGSLYAGGSFGVARLSLETGMIDHRWNAPVNNVSAMAFDGEDHLFVLTLYGLNRISIDDHGARDPAWMPLGDVVTMTFDRMSGNLFLGGNICPPDDQGPCRRLAKISSAGVFDLQWNPPVEDGRLGPLGIDASGRVVAVVTNAVSEVFRIATDGAGLVDPLWHPPIDGDVRALAFRPDGSTWLGGDFGRVGDATRRALARVDAQGQAEGPRSDATNPGIVNAIVLQPDEHVVVGGEFAFDDASGTRTNLLRLRPDGRFDTGWSANTDGAVRALAVDGEGAVYVGGSFETIGGVARRDLAKIGADVAGTVDALWDPSPAPGIRHPGVDKLAVHGDQLFVGGDFHGIGGDWRRNGLARVSTHGEGLADPSWSPAVYVEGIDAMVVGPDGALYAAGDFPYGMGRLGRIGADGVVDTAWSPSLDGPVEALYVDAQSNVFAAGAFTAIDGLSQPRLARLSGIDGAVDDTWRPALSSPFVSLWETWPTNAAIAGKDGDLYVAGAFDGVDGIDACYVAKLSAATGAADPDWNPCPSDGIPPYETPFPAAWFVPVRAMVVRSDGSVIAGGDFERMSGITRNGLAALPPGPLPDRLFVDGFEPD